VGGLTAPDVSVALISFSKTKKLCAGISLGVGAVAARDAMNTSYDNAPPKTIDTVVRRSVTNPKADPLLTIVKNATNADCRDSNYFLKHSWLGVKLV
jgi:lipid-binding SYLF domain-containing protein